MSQVNIYSAIENSKKMIKFIITDNNLMIIRDFVDIER
jgi:hypothetical protein